MIKWIVILWKWSLCCIYIHVYVKGLMVHIWIMLLMLTWPTNQKSVYRVCGNASPIRSVFVSLHFIMWHQWTIPGFCAYTCIHIFFWFFFLNVWNVRICWAICDAIALVVLTGFWIIGKRNVLHVVCVWEGKMTGVITLYQVHLGCVHYRNRNDKN